MNLRSSGFFALRPRLLLAAVSAAASLALARDVSENLTAESPFLEQNQAAMTRMMSAMAVKPSGDVDRDFVASMIPHHQGAIDMAIAVLCYGRNEQVRRLAQEIIVTQQQEISALRTAVGAPLPRSTPSPTQSNPGCRHTQ